MKEAFFVCRDTQFAAMSKVLMTIRLMCIILISQF